MAKQHRRKIYGNGGVKRCKERDRISNLCDAVIHHIMSFLPPRDAAQTCVLSRRWRHVWACIPILDFDLKRFNANRSGNCGLAEFMSGAIMCRQSVPIQKFRASLDYRSLYYFTILQWINKCIMCKVQEVHLNFLGGPSRICFGRLYSTSTLSTPDDDGDEDAGGCGYCDNSISDSSDDELEAEADYSDDDTPCNDPESLCFTLVPILFTYGSLRVLQLTKCNINHKGEMKFGTLRTLSLTEVNVPESVLHKMLSSCCILENLELKHIIGLRYLEVSAPQLQQMKLECCNRLREVSIKAPELRYFKCVLGLKMLVLSFHAPALIKVELGLCHNLGHRRDKLIDKLTYLLGKLGHAEDLTLYSRYFKDMFITKSELKSFPDLYNVKRLQIMGRMDSDAIFAIAGLLRAFYNLESLCLTMIPFPRGRIEYRRQQNWDCPSINSLQLHLKELKMQRFQGNDDEVKLLKFLLEKAKVLERVDIKTYTTSSLSHGEIKARLSQWSASQDARVKYD